MSIQSKQELEDFYNDHDPWDYENNKNDERRKNILLSEIDTLAIKPKSVLDIGCGHGFITRDLPGDIVVGVDISKKAISQAKNKNTHKKTRYITLDMFELNSEALHTKKNDKFDLIIITGVLYPQYIGRAVNSIYEIVDSLLAKNGFLISVHIDEWYSARFPYIMLKNRSYPYREYEHNIEVYIKK